MTLHTALSLPRLNTRQLQACNLIAQRGSGLALTLLDGSWQASLRPSPRTEQGTLPMQQLHFEWAGAPWVLALPEAALEQTIAHAFEGVVLSEIPISLRSAAIEACLEDVLDRLQSLGRGRPLLQEIGGAQTATLPPHQLQLQLRADATSHAWCASLYTNDIGLLQLAGLLSTRLPTAPVPPCTVPITLHVEIGCSHVGINELTHLQPGDWVRLDHCYFTPERVLWLSADGQAGLHVHLAAPTNASDKPEPPRLTVLSSWIQTMPNSEQEPIPSEQPVTLDQVPIRLSFDLGSLTLPLAQIQALQPGQILNLSHPISGAVRLRANGAFIGEADLVEIDGQIGVCVRHVFNMTNHTSSTETPM